MGKPREGAAIHGCVAAQARYSARPLPKDSALIEIVPIAAVDADSVEALLDRAFGTDRHGRTAYRIRSGASAIPELSFAALEGGMLVGTIQCWPVALTCEDGEQSPIVMVGPVAVEPGRQRDGIGRELMAHMLAAADASIEAGHDALALIGDPEYYERFFGFTADCTGGWRLPGPFEARRLLARGPKVPGCAGELGPRIAAHA
ncbi:N-acetyltransferase [soil metagenome]